LNAHLLSGLFAVCAEATELGVDAMLGRLLRAVGLALESAYRLEEGLGDVPLGLAEFAGLLRQVVFATDPGSSSGDVSIGNTAVHLRTAACFCDGWRCPEAIRNPTATGVFGSIAARNFGYAKVRISRVATPDGEVCDFHVYVERALAEREPGQEFVPLPEDRPEAVAPARRRRRGEGAGDAALALVGVSPQMQQIMEAIETLSTTTATVLITGETGVGKELVARALHGHSLRRGGPFVAVNCGAIPETLIESALFGHERGAFTGAHERRQGCFERAEGGTLFLDEVDALSLSAQARLLRVLQEGEYERVGGHVTLRSKARVVAASNRDLREAVRVGQFRSDLYYRLDVVDIHIPPLRERPEDIPVLVEYLWDRLLAKHGCAVPAPGPMVVARLTTYPWPGNVRELENVLERSLLLGYGVIPPESAPGVKAGEGVAPVAELLRPGEPWSVCRRRILEDAERQYLDLLMRRFRGDVARVAAAMELTPRAVYHNLRRYGLHLAAYRGNGAVPA
jgi:two-component system response regulator HydG